MSPTTWIIVLTAILVVETAILVLYTPLGSGARMSLRKVSQQYQGVLQGPIAVSDHRLRIGMLSCAHSSHNALPPCRCEKSKAPCLCSPFNGP